MSEQAKTVTISLEDAALIDRFFLPHNPNKLRAGKGRVPGLKEACHTFKAAVAKAKA